MVTMSQSKEPCPAVEILADFLVGEVSLENLGAISSHLEKCESCLGKLKKLNENRGSAIDKIIRNISKSTENEGVK